MAVDSESLRQVGEIFSRHSRELESVDMPESRKTAMAILLSAKEMIGNLTKGYVKEIDGNVLARTPLKDIPATTELEIVTKRFLLNHNFTYLEELESYYDSGDTATVIVVSGGKYCDWSCDMSLVCIHIINRWRHKMRMSPMSCIRSKGVVPLDRIHTTNSIERQLMRDLKDVHHISNLNELRECWIQDNLTEVKVPGIEGDYILHLSRGGEKIINRWRGMYGMPPMKNLRDEAVEDVTIDFSSKTSSKINISASSVSELTDIDDVLRIGRKFQNEDTWRGAQFDTAKLLCDTIEMLRQQLNNGKDKH